MLPLSKQIGFCSVYMLGFELRRPASFCPRDLSACRSRSHKRQFIQYLFFREHAIFFREYPYVVKFVDMFKNA
jgi:hypothetical protein